jgi:hypothetical protein
MSLNVTRPIARLHHSVTDGLVTAFPHVVYFVLIERMLHFLAVMIASFDWHSAAAALAAIVVLR